MPHRSSQSRRQNQNPHRIYWRPNERERSNCEDVEDCDQRNGLGCSAASLSNPGWSEPRVTRRIQFDILKLAIAKLTCRLTLPPCLAHSHASE